MRPRNARPEGVPAKEALFTRLDAHNGSGAPDNAEVYSQLLDQIPVAETGRIG